MPFVRLPSSIDAPKGYVVIAREQIVRIAPLKGEKEYRIYLTTQERPSALRAEGNRPSLTTVTTTASLASLLPLLGAYIAVQLANASATGEGMNYVPLAKIARIIPTALDDSRVRFLLANGQEIDAALDSHVEALLNAAEQVD